TGSTALTSLPDGPPLIAALFGAVLQLGTLVYVWGYSSARECLADAPSCILRPWSADPWGRTVVFTLTFAIFMWLVSLRTLPATGASDPSIVDRLWSIMPFLYTWHWCLSSEIFLPRQWIMNLVVTFWGGRLTYNFWMKGGFSGGEDYRWE
ncbi:unnamed protein product, partial [Polarella glacialis]